ncbi:UNVERIFIED_CONTAM: hypothetical protein Sradi_6170000 [Sesamum radiatum]|uniref:Transposase n=1 Tax=Sesamum radiatum TaxID=300843 RepID=A0AAW2K8Q0_SESRA
MKKLIKDLGLLVEKIGACKNGCILYWMDDIDLEYCKFCGDARYKPTRGQDPRQKSSPYAVLRYLLLTPCLQRLYSLRATAEHMTWHATHQTKEGSMCHPSDAEAWNLPPGMCMSSEYMFLTMVIPDPSNPKRLTDVYLESLIEELLQLWYVGVRMYNHAMNNEFIMRVALMWIMNGLPAYGMVSGWSNVGVMGCPVCMDDTRAFHLQYGRKACYFDCHKQFLPEHPSQRNKKAFTKNHVENKVARPRLSGDQLLDWVADFSPAIQMLFSLLEGYCSDHKWTKKNIFRDLPYWSWMNVDQTLCLKRSIPCRRSRRGGYANGLRAFSFLMATRLTLHAALT